MNKKICTVSTIKAPLKQTLLWVNYHINIGIDHMFIFFDNPKDPAIDELRKYEKVTCFKCDENYIKKFLSNESILKNINPKNLTMASLSKSEVSFQDRLELNASIVYATLNKNDYSWFFAHLDSDELIYSKKNIRNILSAFDREDNVICVPPLEAVVEKEKYDNIFGETELFKNFGIVFNVYYSNKAFLKKTFSFFRKNEGSFGSVYFRGHAAGKSLVRVGTPIEKFAGHRPVLSNNSKFKFKAASGLHLLHFDSGDFEEWKNKWIGKHKRKNPTKSMNKTRIKIYKLFSKAYENGDTIRLKKMYKKQYMLPNYTKPVLLFFGLLKRIRIKDSFFKKP